MRVLNKYLLQDYLVIFGLTLLIFTFVMCLGAIVKAVDLAARGISGGLIFKVFMLNIPYMMTFSIPVSALTGALLLAGRLSFDGEFTAMRASGVSLWEIVSPLLMVSVVLSLICIYINTSAAPQCRHAVRTMLREVAKEDPINLLEPGRFVRDFPGMMIYVGSRAGSQVEDVVVYQLGEHGPVRDVRAKSGKLRMNAAEQAMYIDLYDVRMDESEAKKGEEPKSHRINFREYPVKLDLAPLQKKGQKRKAADMTMVELIQAIRDIRSSFPELKPEDLARMRMNMVVDANKRIALSLSCFAFTMLGVPLGMRSKRKESSIGILISLLLVFVFYIFIIVSNGLVGYPQFRPDLIVWIPVVGMELLGFLMLKRIN